MLVQVLFGFLIVSLSAAPTQRPGAAPIGSGAEAYSPSKCEWLAVELNANYRVGNIKSGYTAQFYCHKPSTIFLSYKYLNETDKETASQAADGIREIISAVMKERNWKWVKVDDEIIKGEAPVEVPQAVQAKPRKGARKPRKSPDDEESRESSDVKEAPDGEEESADEAKPSSDEDTPEPELHNSRMELKTSPGSSIKPVDNTPQ